LTGPSRADSRMRVVPAADPLADLARLRRPTGPWLHLLDGAPSDARQLGWMLGQDGVVVRILRGHCVRSRYGLFDETAASLQLPGDPVESWAALAGLLTDMGWLPGEGHVLVVSRAALLLAAEPLSELDGLIAMVREVARGRAEEGDPVPFHLVLQDDTLGLAGLRARLDTVGARYDDLTGWDAEEPVAGATLNARTSYRPGDPRLDPLDEAVAAALSTRDGVRAVRRCWEVFSGPDTAQVRVYAPVLTDFVAAGEIVETVAGVVASAGGACLAVPVLADERRQDERQQALLAGSVEVWPAPAAVPEPPPPREPEPVEAADVPPQSTVDTPPSTVDEVVAAPAPPAPPENPHDDPVGSFELVAANLEWSFAAGADNRDAVDEALIRYAGSSDRLAALFRSWVADPAGGWVRVVMAYVASGSISGVETERGAIVDIAQRASAKRCCIEIVGLSDVGDVHRWLEDRSVALWTPAPAPAMTPATATATPPDPATTPAAPEPMPAAAAGQRAELPADSVFQPGPGENDEPALAALAEWAAEQDGITGLVTAWTELAGERTVVVGVVVDDEVDQPAVRAEVAARLASMPAEIRVESFAPSKGLPPVHLRLYRGSTRLWTRKVERVAVSRPGIVQLDTTSSHTVSTSVEQVIDTSEPINDERFENGFTLVGLDLNASVQKGAETPEPRDDAVIAWIGEQPNALALLRAMVGGADGSQFPVYSVLVDADADRPAIRHGVATAIAGTGTPQAGVEVFCPFERIAVFHVQLYGASLSLWKTDRPPPSTSDGESEGEDGAAGTAEPES
jgi:hypothetical protein